MGLDRSLSKRWAAMFPSLPLSKGLRRFCNPFYANEATAAIFRRAGNLIDHLVKPGTSSAAGEYPSKFFGGVGMKRWHQNPQGVTHDDFYWYFSNKESLVRIPASNDLEDISTKLVWELPGDLRDEGYTHIGDIDHFPAGEFGLLYVPIEHEGPPDTPASLLVFDHYFTEVARHVLDTTGEANYTSCPWCAVCPLDGRLYSSKFGDDPGLEVELFAYDITDIRKRSPTFVGTFPLYDEAGRPLRAGGIQGGAFSPLGHLYLAVQWEGTTDQHAGIMGFDMVTGRRFLYQPVDFETVEFTAAEVGESVWHVILSTIIAAGLGEFFGLGSIAESVLIWVGLVKSTAKEVTRFAAKQELEGLTVWDHEGDATSGQLHQVVVAGTLFLWFKHYRVAEPRNL